MNVKMLGLSVLMGASFFQSPLLVSASEKYGFSTINVDGGHAFHEIIETSDQGFLAVGYDYTTQVDYSDGFITKYSSNWRKEWQEVVDGSSGNYDNDSFRDVVQVDDGGFVALFISQQLNKTGDSYLIKYSEDGVQLWKKELQSETPFSSMIKTSDGGIVLAGTSYTSYSSTPTIIKVNQEGEQVWKKTGAYNHTFDTVVELSNGELLAVGNDTNGAYDGIMTKYSSDGIKRWEKTWGGFDMDNLRGVVATSDGGYIIVGDSYYLDGVTIAGQYDAIIEKFDAEGNREWIQSWGGSNGESFDDVIETKDGTFIAVGDSRSTDAGFANQGGYDAILVEYDSEGNELGVKSFGGSGSESFSRIRQFSNGEILISSGQNLLKYGIKKDSDIQINGNIQTMVADVTIPSVSPDLVINPNLQEGFVAPEFTVENQAASPIKLELKTFEQTTNTFNDVLPTKYDSWVGLNKQQSEDIALGLVAKEGDGWQTLTTPTSYVANHSEHEIGIIKSKSSVDFSFDVKHGTAFTEAKPVQYKMIFVFDLMN